MNSVISLTLLFIFLQVQFFLGLFLTILILLVKKLFDK